MQCYLSTKDYSVLFTPINKEDESAMSGYLLYIIFHWIISLLYNLFSMSLDTFSVDESPRCIVTPKPYSTITVQPPPSPLSPLKRVIKVPKFNTAKDSESTLCLTKNNPQSYIKSMSITTPHSKYRRQRGGEQYYWTTWVVSNRAGRADSPHNTWRDNILYFKCIQMYLTTCLGESR